MKAINNFDVLKRMAAENKDIRLGTDLVRMQSCKAGTQVTMGVPGDVIGAIAAGDLHCCVLLYNREQFAATKVAMEAE